MSLSGRTSFQMAVLSACLWFSSPCLAQNEATNESSSGEQPSMNLEGVNEAVTLFKSNRIKECREKLQAARKTQPALPPADTFLAILYLSTGRTALATATLDLAVTNNPEDPEAYVLLADLALKDAQRTVADLGYSKGKALLEGIAEFPKRHEALTIRVHAGMASLAELRGQFAKAEQYLKDWERVVPDSPVITGSLGRVYFKQEKYEQAREMFSKLAKLEPNSAPMEVVMGRLFGESGMTEESTREMRNAVKLYPDDVRVRLAIASRAIKTGNLSLLKENVEAAKKLKPKAVEVGVLTAKLQHIEGDNEAAEKTASALVLAHPNSVTAVNELARILAESEDEDQRKLGLQYARRNYNAVGKTRTEAAVNAIITYAWALFRNNRPADAEVVLRSVPAGSRIGPQETYYSGLIYLDRGQTAAAGSALAAALASNGLFPGRRDCEKQISRLRGN